MDETFDIIIAGGGPVGIATALGLRGSGLKLALIEARAGAGAAGDSRSIALSLGSQRILDRLGVWTALSALATPITQICVSQQRGFGRVELRAQDAAVPALGYVASYGALQSVFATSLESTSLKLIAGSRVERVDADATAAVAVLASGRRLAARLIVIADGGAHLDIAHVKTRDYHQSAVTCDVVSEQSHHHRAFERFAPEGPLALLPLANGWSLVWTMGNEQAQQLSTLDDRAFCERLQAAFGQAVGPFISATRRQVFTLALRYALQPVAPRTLLIGNAAQSLHPVAGQGLNLGLRDAWELVRTINARSDDDDLGSRALSNRYFSQRRFDRIATILFTDSLIRLFCKDIPFLSGARGLGLTVFGATSSAKNFLARRMMFGARG